jgi:hypothetical protein
MNVSKAAKSTTVPLKHGVHVPFSTHLVTSNRTAVPYRYYDVPGCLSPIRGMLASQNYKRGYLHRTGRRDRRSRTSRPDQDQPLRDDSTLSNLFLGDEIQRPSPYLIHVTQDQPCTPLCHTTLNFKDIRRLQHLIQQQYRFQMSIQNKSVTESSNGQIGYPIGFFQPRQQTLKQQPASATTSTDNNTLAPHYEYSRYKAYDYAIYNHVDFQIYYRHDRNDEPAEGGDGVIQITQIHARPKSISHLQPSSTASASSNLYGIRSTSTRYNTCDKGGPNTDINAPTSGAVWLPRDVKPRTRLTIAQSYQVHWIRSEEDTDTASVTNTASISPFHDPYQDNQNHGPHVTSRWSTGTALLLALAIPVLVLWTTKMKNSRSANVDNRKKEDQQADIEMKLLRTNAFEPQHEREEENYDWMEKEDDNDEEDNKGHDRHNHHRHHHNRDLFVATPLPPVVCQLSGLGAQLCATTLIFLILQPLQLRPLVLILWSIYALCGVVSGYVSSRLQKLFLVSSADRSLQISWHAVLAGMLLPLLAWLFLLVRNLILILAGAATVTSMKSFFLLLCLVTFVQIPLTVAGVWMGYRAPQFPHQPQPTTLRILERSVSSLSLDDESGHLKDDDDNLKKRTVKSDPWYLPLARNLAGGIVPFVVLHPEWYLWIQTIWNVPTHHLLEESYHKDVWHALFLFMGVCCESCVLVSCLDWYLRREQYAYHHQWWRSFWNGASIGFFFFLYSLQYAWRGLHLIGWVSKFLYGGIIILLSLCLGLFGGFFGVLFSLGFALYLYYYEKNSR